MNFGRAIRTIAAARGLSQRDLARRAEMDEGYLSRICSADGPSTLVLIRIARALECPLYLLVLLASDADDLSDDTLDVALGARLLATLVR